MPPRARKKAAPKPAPEETETVTEVQDARDEAPEIETDADQPKRRGGRKRSELAHAAREYEQADDAVVRLEAQYSKVAVRLSEIGAKLSEARTTRDNAWKIIEDARNVRTAPDVADPSLVDDESDDE